MGRSPRNSRSTEANAPSPAAALAAAAQASTGEAGAGPAERSLRLLALLGQADGPVSLATLCEQLDLPKATVHRLCGQLMVSGHVARDVDERAYTVGPAMRRLALETLHHGGIRGLRHRVLADLVAEVGETCNFTTLDGASVLYLDRVEAPWPWRLTLDVGAHVPLHCTASGKLMLAMLPEDRREAMLGSLALTAMTPRTITSAAALRRECAVIASRGHAFDREEFIPGLIAAAVPVTDAQGEVRATLAVHAPVARMDLRQAEARLPALHRAAQRMRALL